MASADVEIPKQYKAAVYDAPGKISTKIETLDTPEPGPGEWRALPAPIQPGQVGGHEGVGVVAKMGPATERAVVKVGQRVGVKWVAGTCGNCPPCLEGHDALCYTVKLASRGMAMRVIGIDAGSKEKLVRECGAEHFIDVTKHDDKSIGEEVMKTADGLGASAVIV
ncbi:MAG: hypothetical protein Q9193_000929 [Seirophora villosa]